MKKKKKKSDLSWALFMLMIKFNLWRSYKVQAFKKWFYCRRGYHKIMPNYIEISKSTKSRKGMRVVLRAHWVECPICETKFFSSEEDKKKYENYQKREKKLWGRFFEQFNVKTTHTKAVNKI